MFLTKEQILTTNDLEIEEVEVWGGKILVRGITATERESLRKESGDDGSKEIPNLIVKLVALTIVNEKGESLFSEEDVEALGKKSAQSLDKVFAVAQRLSGLDPESVKEIEKK